MKNAATCDAQCELQVLVNNQIFKYTLCLRDIPRGIHRSVSANPIRSYLPLTWKSVVGLWRLPLTMDPLKYIGPYPPKVSTRVGVGEADGGR